MTTLTCSEPLSRVPDLAPPGDLWAIVLAAGEGGKSRPLRSTLERVAQLVPPERTVVVSQTGDADAARDLAGRSGIHVLSQPLDRGSAASVLLPAHWIQARDPRATVAVFPTDPVVVEAAPFMHHVAGAAGYAHEHPDWLVLLGAPPTDPHPHYGWIEPGEPMSWVGHGAVHRVRRFREKPTEESARGLFALGALWNTFTFAATAAALIEAGRECVPLLHDRLVRLGVFAGTQFEPWALRQAYLFAPVADFSRTILESSPLPIAVARLPAFTWRALIE